MDKNSARNQIYKAGMSTYDIAYSIYLATVEGVSGANQNDGYGFALSAIAELWNIRGTISNPNGRTKITGRYKGMGVTEGMILNVISQYPDGINGRTPLFDDLLGIGSSGRGASSSLGGSRGISSSLNESSNAGRIQGQSGSDSFLAVIVVITFVIMKFFIGWGWIISIIGALVVGGIVDMIKSK